MQKATKTGRPNADDIEGRAWGKAGSCSCAAAAVNEGAVYGMSRSC